MTYHFPYMKTNIQSKINEGYPYSDLEFFDEDTDEAGLEDVGVEEEQEHHNDRKQNTYILNTEEKKEKRNQQNNHKQDTYMYILTGILNTEKISAFQSLINAYRILFMYDTLHCYMFSYTVFHITLIYKTVLKLHHLMSDANVKCTI